MNVLIDATGIAKKKAGVGVYAKNLIYELVNSRPDIHLFILAQNDDQDFNYRDQDKVTVIRVPSKFFRILPLRFLLEQIGIPFLLLKHRIDVLHSLHYSFPIFHFRTKQVVTLHDMTFFDMPEVHVPIKIYYFRFFIRAAVSLADGIIFVSCSAQQDCNTRLGLPQGQSFVIHHGKSEAFRPDLDSHLVQKVRSKFGLLSDFILYIGTIEPRKNLTRLVAAFASIAEIDPDIILVIAGMNGWGSNDLFEKVRNLNLESRVKFVGFIPEEDKAFLLSAARIFVYPSIYEGFGIPVLEALACGIPTITSKTSSLPEVAGDAALLVNPTSVIEISDAMQQLLSDTTLRKKMREDSLVQAAKFTWQKTATSTLKAYIEVLKSTAD